MQSRRGPGITLSIKEAAREVAVVNPGRPEAPGRCRVVNETGIGAIITEDRETLVQRQSPALRKFSGKILGIVNQPQTLEPSTYSTTCQYERNTHPRKSQERLQRKHGNIEKHITPLKSRRRRMQWHTHGYGHQRRQSWRRENRQPDLQLG